MSTAKVEQQEVVVVPGTQGHKPNPSSRGWGKRGGGSGRGRLPPTNVNAPTNRGNGSGGVIPPGQYLSKTSSELNNDPLSQKAYFPGPSEEFRAVAQRQKIYPGCTALPILCEETYNKISGASPSYSKQVPRCAHDYYIAVLTYARLLSLHHKNGGSLTLGELNFIEQIQQAEYSVPKSISLYLAGMGDTKAPRSRELIFGLIKPNLKGGVVPVCDNEIAIPGYFGPINQNLGAYANYPCLAVYAQKILQDLIRSNAAPGNEAQWDLPNELAYAGHRINQNCLGYRDSVRMSTEHQTFLSNCNVSTVDFEFDNDELPINNEIMSAVHLKLAQTRLPLSKVPTTKQGSVGQLPWLEISQQSTKRATTANYVGNTMFEMPSSEGWLGCAFMYNVQKQYPEIAKIKSLMPVTFTATSALTPASIASLNELYTRTADWIKPTLYSIIPFSPVMRAEIIAERDI